MVEDDAPVGRAEFEAMKREVRGLRAAARSSLRRRRFLPVAGRCIHPAPATRPAGRRPPKK